MIAALFDLDGVVVDTEPQYTVFWNEIGKEHFPQEQNFSGLIKGQTLTHILTKYFPDAKLQGELRKRLSAFEQSMRYPYVAGVTDYIKSLHERHIATAIVTSSDRAKMAFLYAAHPEIEQLFGLVVTAESVKNSKPAPDCYLHAAEILQVPISGCVVFEDSLNGLASGRAAGAKVVGLATTLPADTIRPLCDYCIADFSQAELLSADL